MGYELSALAFEISDDLDEQLRVLQSEGIKNLEFRMVGGRDVLSFTPAEIDEVAKRISDAGIRVSSLASPIGKGKLESFKSDELRKALDYAHRLGSPRVRVFSFEMPKGEDPADYEWQVIHKLGTMAWVADGSDIVLCHENETGRWGETGERSWRMYQQIPELRAVFDPANFVRSGCNPVECLDMIRDRVEYFHIKDMSRATGQYVMVGEGDAQIRDLLRAFNPGDREVILSLEPSMGAYDASGKRQLTGPETFRRYSAALKTILDEIGSARA